MNTQYYELMYVIPLKYAGEALQPTVDEVQAKLEELKAEIHLHEQFGKLKFSYKIDNQHQGFYYLVEFTGEKESVKVLHDWLQLKKEILRFILLKKVPGQRSSIDAGKEQLREQAEQDQKDVPVKKVQTTERVNKDDRSKKPTVVKAESQISEKEIKTIVKSEEDSASSAKDEEQNTASDDNNKISLEEIDKKLDEILDSDIPTI